ncbi:hypothetical protein GWI33_016750 [Rhynchophorus ferrugineus]|uniref:Uncharacterized protein n=1 Tax=Rhynchophorus ferrugineus TaxID=354439 RepID=A0A834M6V2_RHYFE|nr:hypothetical protein GWI33_016750 [Rhynchophorus ferrugineus]
MMLETLNCTRAYDRDCFMTRRCTPTLLLKQSVARVGTREFHGWRDVLSTTNSRNPARGVICLRQRFHSHRSGIRERICRESPEITDVNHRTGSTIRLSVYLWIKKNRFAILVNLNNCL